MILLKLEFSVALLLTCLKGLVKHRAFFMHGPAGSHCKGVVAAQAPLQQWSSPPGKALRQLLRMVLNVSGIAEGGAWAILTLNKVLLLTILHQPNSMASTLVWQNPVSGKEKLLPIP